MDHPPAQIVKKDHIFVIGSVIAVLGLFAMTLPRHSTETIRGQLTEYQLSESGSVENSEDLLLSSRMARITLTQGFLLRANAKESEMMALKKEQDARRIKRILHRRNCREEMRKANKETQLETLLRCERAQLTLLQEQVRREKIIVEETDGISDSVRSSASASSNALLDAIAAIINGIDAGVYTDEDALVEAKINLARLYQIPYWHGNNQIAAERLLSWMSHLWAVQTDNGTTTHAAAPLALCFLEAESLLNGVLMTEYYEEGSNSLHQAHDLLKQCLPPKVTPPTDTGSVTSGHESAPKKVPDYLPRRLLRRL